jgi:hypothetical protein
MCPMLSSGFLWWARRTRALRAKHGVEEGGLGRGGPGACGAPRSGEGVLGHREWREGVRVKEGELAEQQLAGLSLLS